MSKIRQMIKENPIQKAFDDANKEITRLQGEIDKANELLSECWSMVGNDLDFESGGYSTICEHVNAQKEVLIKANERVKELEKLTDTLYPIARSHLWIAYAWNDHNFPYQPEKYARQAAQEADIKNLDDANNFLEAIEQLRKGGE